MGSGGAPGPGHYDTRHIESSFGPIPGTEGKGWRTSAKYVPPPNAKWRDDLNRQLVGNAGELSGNAVPSQFGSRSLESKWRNVVPGRIYPDQASLSKTRRTKTQRHRSTDFEWYLDSLPKHSRELAERRGPRSRQSDGALLDASNSRQGKAASKANSLPGGRFQPTTSLSTKQRERLRRVMQGGNLSLGRFEDDDKTGGSARKTTRRQRGQLQRPRSSIGERRSKERMRRESSVPKVPSDPAPVGKLPGGKFQPVTCLNLRQADILAKAKKRWEG